MGQSNQECKETSRIKCVSHVEKVELRRLLNKKMIILGSVTHLILGFAIVQIMYYFLCYHKPISMTITSSLRFLYIFDGSGLLCGVGAVHSTEYNNLAASSFLL